MQGICKACGQSKTVHKNRKTGKLVCKNCYYDHFAWQEKCSKCNDVGRIACRKGKKIVCSKCYHKSYAPPRQECSRCHKTKPVENWDGDQPVCGVCYKKSRIGECAECKKKKVIQALGLCYACYKRRHRAKLAQADP